MQLERVRIKGYKCLQDVDVQFRRPEAEGEHTSTHLLVGVNGTGKSCFLEALGLIFTRVAQGETPGFSFELCYRMKLGRARVCVRPAKKGSGEKLEVRITEDGQTRRLGVVPEEYRPRRIIACCSGANNLMEAVLLSSPRASLVSDIYDASFLETDVREKELSLLMERYQSLDQDPRMLYLDASLSKLVIPVLFAVVPDFREPEKAAQFCALRETLTSRISTRFEPVACAITVDEAALEQCLEQYQKSPQYEILNRLLQPEENGREAVNDWAVSRVLLPAGPQKGNEQMERMERTAVFCYSRMDPERQNSGWHEKLTRECGGDPMYLLSVLLTALRAGVLTRIQFSFQAAACQTLLGLEALSDGELIWLAQMGLILMSRLRSSADTLFLLDEPDVHFNDDWNKDFINTIQMLGRRGERPLDHEFVIATHSTLLMTDAYQEQVSLFSHTPGRGTQVKAPPISAFAAGQEEIARWLFDATAIGTYAQERVDQELKEADTPEELQGILRATGPGYERFRLYERYFELQDPKEG